MKYRLKPLEVMLSIYIFGMLIVNVMGPKVMPLGSIGSLQFNISVIIFLMPLLYTIIDCISEVYGRARARSFVLMGLLCIVLLMGFTALAIALPGGVRGKEGLQKQEYEFIFGVSLRFAFASVAAFFVGEITDVLIYSKLRAATRGKMMWLRNNVSNIVGEFLDSAVFTTIAFYSFAKSIPDNFMWIMGVIIPLWIAKCIMSFVSTPLVYIGTKYLRTAPD
jgi:uncharacterized integral membrane protein (TIGR00697 family)